MMLLCKLIAIVSWFDQSGELRVEPVLKNRNKLHPPCFLCGFGCRCLNSHKTIFFELLFRVCYARKVNYMFIKRDIEHIIGEYKKFPVIAILGPRQSGKTTLSKNLFSNHIFLDLEDPALKLFAQEDPRRFLKEYENEHGIIIDEFQYVPELLSYIKIIVDEQKRPGYFVITGSQNFLMNEAITQSLAGRVGIVTLLPLSINELQSSALLDSYTQTIINGFYPRIYAEHILPDKFYSSYIQTYIEKDVRQLSHVMNLHSFQLFLKLCAGRTGQQLNSAELATTTGIDQKTVHRWLSILESSYIIFLLQPFYNNFNKRLTKAPKLYFYDTGIAAYLLGIKKNEDLALSPFRGSLFENLIIADLLKQNYNKGELPNIYYWRDQNGRIEIDCVIDKATTMVPLEIKSSETISPSFFDNLKQFNEIAQISSENNIIVYAGSTKQSRSAGTIINWERAGSLL